MYFKLVVAVCFCATLIPVAIYTVCTMDAIFVHTQGSRGSNSGTDVATLGERFDPSPSTGTLTIVEIDLLDEQWYWCEASSPVDKILGKSYFEVQGEVDTSGMGLAFEVSAI